jgi:chromosome partitioning protein
VPERRTRIIAVANQKGGVGKSTTAVSLGAALAELGHRVLVVDLDPQGNASTGLGIRHEARQVTVYDVLAADAPMTDAVIATPVENLFAVPSTIDLAGAEIELVSQFSRELRLRKALEPLRDGQYDFVLLDCPPSLGLLTVNALAAAEELIVPIQCEYYALEGLGQLLRNVRLVQQNVNPGLKLTGIVMTMFDPRTRLSEQVVDEVRKFFGDRVYRTIIPRTVRLSEAPGFGQPITVYDPRSKGAECYRDLAREVAEREPPEEPMPAFDSLPIVVVPPPEPHVMTAPHPMSRAQEPEGEVDDSLAGGEDRGPSDAVGIWIPPPQDEHDLDASLEEDRPVAPPIGVDVDRPSTPDGAGWTPQVEPDPRGAPVVPGVPPAGTPPEGPEVEATASDLEGDRESGDGPSSLSPTRSEEPAGADETVPPPRVQPPPIIVIEDDVDIHLPEHGPEEPEGPHDEEPKRRFGLFRRGGKR